MSSSRSTVSCIYIDGFSSYLWACTFHTGCEGGRMAQCCSGCNMTGRCSTSPLRAALSWLSALASWHHCPGLVCCCPLVPHGSLKRGSQRTCTHSFRNEPRKSSQQKIEALARVPVDEVRLNSIAHR